MMKYFKLSFISLLLVTLLSGCDNDLPYEDRTETAIFDIVRTPGTKGIIEGGFLEGKYGINLTHTEMFGDLSTLDYIQLACIYYPNKTEENYLSKAQNKVIIDEIRDFSTRGIEFELKDLYAKFGLTNLPVVGEVFTFVINTVLKDGTVIPGWTLYQVDGNYKEQFNNQGFTAWELDGRGYSYSVTYSVTCPLVIDDYLGKMTMGDNTGMFNAATEYEVNIELVKETESAYILKVQPFGGDVDDNFEVNLEINKEDYSVRLPKTVLLPTLGNYTNFYVSGSGTALTCEGTLRIANGTVGVDQGTYVNGKGVWTWKK